ncbi:hypothetical protein AMECASPLE_004796 [Ameca splendens]|uniref:Uncharacterized protein n=1 Tax=Ameca splendens TaxID=208324 RepID=A0ABV0YL85_9TELE
MNKSTEEGISLVATAGDAHNTRQAAQSHTIRNLSGRFLSPASNYSVIPLKYEKTFSKNILTKTRSEKWGQKKSARKQSEPGDEKMSRRVENIDHVMKISAGETNRGKEVD